MRSTRSHGAGPRSPGRAPSGRDRAIRRKARPVDIPALGAVHGVAHAQDRLEEIHACALHVEGNGRTARSAAPPARAAVLSWPSSSLSSVIPAGSIHRALLAMHPIKINNGNMARTCDSAGMALSFQPISSSRPGRREESRLLRGQILHLHSVALCDDLGDPLRWQCAWSRS